MFQEVLSGFHGYLKEVCQGGCNGVSGSFKSVKKKCQGYFNIISIVFQGRLKGILREISVTFKVI